MKPQIKVLKYTKKTQAYIEYYNRVFTGAVKQKRGKKWKTVFCFSSTDEKLLTAQILNILKGA